MSDKTYITEAEIEDFARKIIEGLPFEPSKEDKAKAIATIHKWFLRKHVDKMVAEIFKEVVEKHVRKEPE